MKNKKLNTTTEEINEVQNIETVETIESFQEVENNVMTINKKPQDEEVKNISQDEFIEHLNFLTIENEELKRKLEEKKHISLSEIKRKSEHVLKLTSDLDKFKNSCKEIEQLVVDDEDPHESTLKLSISQYGKIIFQTSSPVIVTPMIELGYQKLLDKIHSVEEDIQNSFQI